MKKRTYHDCAASNPSGYLVDGTRWTGKSKLRNNEPKVKRDKTRIQSQQEQTFIHKRIYALQFVQLFADHIIFEYYWNTYTRIYI